MKHEVESAYDIGDKVFMMQGNEIVAVFVEAIAFLKHRNKKKPQYWVSFEDDTNIITTSKEFIKESLLFPTKEALLEHLKNA